ncbi:YHYH protein [Parasediminibacterium paludis]|uniref:YHYH protein n=1 Tax=Parasediminibacterium paludis TaxID=908966 RepID=A0ABV8PTX8_9BACT
MKKISVLACSIATLAAISFIACKKDDGTATTTTTSNATLPTVFSKFNSSVSISVSGDYVVLTTNDIPDHKSPYFATSDSRYEAYNGANTAYSKNPNSIVSQNITFKIPISPAVASTHAATPLGPMGIAVNGVVIYNQYAAGGVPLTGEINSFDQYNGHPQMSGQYHYHVEPTYITAAKGKSALIGFLLDGFPIYGPVENGVTLTSSSSTLDVYHGHTSATADYPNGIYHYHITADAPYINGNGFYGTAGTVTQ